MATPTTFSFIKSTPCSVVYNIAAGVGAGTIDFDPAMKANMVAGPLKTELARRNGSLNQLNLDLDSSRVRIYYVTGIDSAQVVPAGSQIIVAWTTTGLSATIPNGEVGQSLLIEIRFEHSEKR